LWYTNVQNFYIFAVDFVGIDSVEIFVMLVVESIDAVTNVGGNVDGDDDGVYGVADDTVDDSDAQFQYYHSFLDFDDVDQYRDYYRC
jgi:hypothetical protein